MNKGYVYVLSNPCMPGIVKIGRSMHGGQGRADALYRNDTGVPMPFVLEFEILLPDAVRIEKEAHFVFSSERVNSGREFFSVPISEAIAVITCLAHDDLGIEIKDIPSIMNSAFSPDGELTPDRKEMH